MKTKSVFKTVYPDGKVELHPFGMIPKRYVAKNTIKQGGICLNWAMENTLKQVKEVLNER